MQKHEHAVVKELGVRRLMQYQRKLLETVRNEILQVLLQKKEVELWSAGSGIDVVSLMLKQEFQDQIKVTVFDISDECIAQNEKLFNSYGLSAAFAVGDILDSRYDGQFDIVMNTGLLEHFGKADQERILQVISRSLVTGGSYVTLTPFAGGRLYLYFLRKAQSKGALDWPEEPIATLRDMNIEGLTLVDEYPVGAIDQLALVGFALPALAVLLEPVRMLANRHEAVAEPILQRFFGAYCLFNRFVRTG